MAQTRSTGGFGWTEQPQTYPLFMNGVAAKKRVLRLSQPPVAGEQGGKSDAYSPPLFFRR